MVESSIATKLNDDCSCNVTTDDLRDTMIECNSENIIFTTLLVFSTESGDETASTLANRLSGQVSFSALTININGYKALITAASIINGSVHEVFTASTTSASSNCVATSTYSNEVATSAPSNGNGVTTSSSSNGVTTSSSSDGVTTSAVPSDGVTTSNEVTTSSSSDKVTTSAPFDGVTTSAPSGGVTTFVAPSDGVTILSAPSEGVTTSASSDGVTTSNEVTTSTSSYGLTCSDECCPSAGHDLDSIGVNIGVFFGGVIFSAVFTALCIKLFMM